MQTHQNIPWIPYWLPCFGSMNEAFTSGVPGSSELSEFQLWSNCTSSKSEQILAPDHDSPSSLRAPTSMSVTLSHVVLSFRQRLAFIWAASCQLCRGRQPVHFAREFRSRMKPVTRQRLQPGGLPVAKHDLRVIEFTGSGLGVLHLTCRHCWLKGPASFLICLALWKRASPPCPYVRNHLNY